MSRNNKKLISFFLAAILNLSCGFLRPMPGWDDCEKGNPAETKKKSPETSNYLVVYLDTSASINGYVAEKEKQFFAISPDNETIYSKTLLELRTVLSSLNPQPQILLREVSADLSEPAVDDLALSRLRGSAKLFEPRQSKARSGFKPLAMEVSTDIVHLDPLELPKKRAERQ